MTIEEKIGQMLLVRMDKNIANSMISDYHVSGFVLFASDFKDKTSVMLKGNLLIIKVI